MKPVRKQPLTKLPPGRGQHAEKNGGFDPLDPR